MTEPNKRVWNKLAISGTYRGHPTGPFSMSSQTFAEIERNFRNDNIPIPIDWDHAMEQPVSESAAKARGEAPAAGWIHALEARPDGSLWGETEWLPETRKKILNHEYRFVSPAIRFNASDTVSGLNVGAKLSSAAVTNRPFLKALPPLQANDANGAFLCSEVTGAELVALEDTPAIYAYSANEYLPRFRSILKLDDTASADSMIDKLDRIEELVEQADGDTSATVDGVCLSNYIVPLREFMRLPTNTHLSDLLDAAADMIEDSQGVEMSDIPSVTPQEQTTPSAPVITPKEPEIVMETITLSEHTVKLSEAVATAVKNATSPLELQLKDLEAKVVKASEDTALEAAKVLALSEQIKVRDAAVASARVEEAFISYKETKKLSDDDKEAMAITLSTKPELFEKLYPKMTVAQSVLLRTVTASDTSSASKVGATKVVPEFKKILDDVKAKNPGLTYDQQFDLAVAAQTTLMAA